MRQQWFPLAIGVAFMALGGCSDSSPPSRVFESIVVARPGIDDFGELTVRELSKAMAKAAKVSGGSATGWSEKDDIYYFHVTMSPNAEPTAMAFRPLNEEVTLAYPIDNPIPLATIQAVRVLMATAYADRQ